MRKTSDDLCREHGLSVLEEKICGKHNIDYTKYYKSYIQRTDYYTTTKSDLDFAISKAYSYKNFEKLLQDMGYKITIRANKISLLRPPYKRNIRIERAFGNEYSIANIEERILYKDVQRKPMIEVYKKPKYYRSKNSYSKFKIDRGSLYRLYLYYCYLLKVYPNQKETRKNISPEIRKEVKKMNEISEQIKFLCRNKIKNTKELFLYKKNITDELKDKVKVRNALRRKRKKEEKPKVRQELCNQILDLSDKIKYLKQEVDYCEKIENQSQKIKENMREIEIREKELSNKKNRRKGVIQR